MDRSITVIIRDASDVACKGIVEVLQHFVNAGLTHSFLDLPIADVEPNTAGIGDLSCRDISATSVIDDTFLHAVSRVPDLSILRLAVVNAEDGDPQRVNELSNVVKRLHDWLSQLQGQAVKVVDVRIGLRAFGEPLPAVEFYPVTSNVNILAIPQDRITDGGIARPISRGTDNGASSPFAVHGAVELSSLVGLWISMGDAPVDEMKPMLAGSAVPRIHFSQTRVRALSCPGLQMDRIAPNDEDLPTPKNHFSVVDSSYAAHQLAQRIYPQHLEFVAEPEPDYFTYDSNLRRLIPAFLREMGRTIIGIPRIAFRGVQDELHAIAGEGLQQAVGTDSWLQVLWAGRDGDKVSISSHEVQVETVIRAIEGQYRRELLSPLSGSDWTSLLQATFAGVDGHVDGASQRLELFGNDKLLLLKRTELSSVSESLTETLAAMASKIQIRTGLSSRPTRLSQPVESIEEPSSEKSESETQETEEEQQPELVDSVEESVIVPLIVEPRGLVELIGERFRREAQAAHDHVGQMIDRLRMLYGQLEVRDTSSVSPIFNVMMALALSSLFFVVSACTDFRKVMSFEGLSSATEDALWTGFSAIYVVAAILMLGIGGKKSWQARAAISSLIVSVMVAILVVFFGDLREWVQVEKGRPYGAIGIAVGTAVLVVIAIVRSIASVSPLRRRLGRALAVSVGFYLLVGVSVWQAREGSVISRSSDDVRSRIFLVVLIISLLVILSSLIFVSVVVIRERNRLNALAKSLEWARMELVTSVDAEKRLTAAAHQWLATGSVVARLLSHPLGLHDSPASRSNQAFSLTRDVLKFDVAKLNLSELGDTKFLASLRKNFVEPGWITRQYEKLVRQYQDRLAARTSNKVEDVREKRPECDPEALSIDELLDGTCSAERYRFAQSVFAGAFDSALRELPPDFNLNDIYEPIINDGSSYSLDGARNTTQSIAEFLSQIIPSSAPKLPVGLVTRTFTANAPEQGMKTSIWWPSQILGAAPSSPLENETHESSIRSNRSVTDDVELLAVRVDLSQPFLYTECEHRLVDVSQGLSNESSPHGLTDL